jgi:hypothetical protein
MMTALVTQRNSTIFGGCTILADLQLGVFSIENLICRFNVEFLVYELGLKEAFVS